MRNNSTFLSQNENTKVRSFKEHPHSDRHGSGGIKKGDFLALCLKPYIKICILIQPEIFLTRSQVGVSDYYFTLKIDISNEKGPGFVGGL